jgi:hypothetical protein
MNENNVLNLSREEISISIIRYDGEGGKLRTSVGHIDECSGEKDDE